MSILVDAVAAKVMELQPHSELEAVKDTTREVLWGLRESGYRIVHEYCIDEEVFNVVVEKDEGMVSG
jgi:hypothetical protein